MFIVVEGIEGSGKSSLAESLARALRDEGREVVATREPGGTAAGDAIRALFLDRNIEIEPLTEVFLVNAARAQHVEQIIRPALASGKILLCDRFTDSTLAYQGYGRQRDVELVRGLCEAATGALRPDLVLVLDLPVNVARTRLRERAHVADRIEAEGDAFHERVRTGFLTLAKGSASHRVLDATLPRESLLKAALDEAGARLRARVS